MNDCSVEAPAWSLRPCRWHDPKSAIEQVRVLAALYKAKTEIRPQGCASELRDDGQTWCPGCSPEARVPKRRPDQRGHVRPRRGR